MIEQLIYSYVEKNFKLISKVSLDVLYILNSNGEVISKRSMFNELKTVFGLTKIEEEEYIFKIYLKWVRNKKEELGKTNVLISNYPPDF